MGGSYDVDESFPLRFYAISQMCTSACWAEAWLAIIFDNTEDCNLVIFMILYLIFAFIIIVNMYITVIQENFEEVKDDVLAGITDEDYNMFYEAWQEFDLEGTQYMPYNQLSEILNVLEPPLQISRPNKFKII